MKKAKKRRVYTFINEGHEAITFQALNWHINRNRLPLMAGYKEWRQYLRRISYQRVL